MRLRYATKDILQALGRMPCKYSALSSVARNRSACLLRARFLAVDINIKPGEAGLKEDKPIDVDGGVPQAGSSRDRGIQDEVEQEVVVKSEVSEQAPPVGDSKSQIAADIAEAEVCRSLDLQADLPTLMLLCFQELLSELTERKRLAEAQQNILQAGVKDGLESQEIMLQRASKRPFSDNEVDNKENVFQQASKRLKTPEAVEDGFVMPKLERD
jgi:hypothetical protein